MGGIFAANATLGPDRAQFVPYAFPQPLVHPSIFAANETLGPDRAQFVPYADPQPLGVHRGFFDRGGPASQIFDGAGAFANSWLALNGNPVAQAELENRAAEQAARLRARSLQLAGNDPAGPRDAESGPAYLPSTDEEPEPLFPNGIGNFALPSFDSSFHYGPKPSGRLRR